MFEKFKFLIRKLQLIWTQVFILGQFLPVVCTDMLSIIAESIYGTLTSIAASESSKNNSGHSTC
jgi:hypothetical protein